MVMRVRTIISSVILICVICASLMYIGPTQVAGSDNHSDPLAGAQIRTDLETGQARMVIRTGGYLTGPSSESPENIALQFMKDNRNLFGLSGSQVKELEVAASLPIKHNGAWNVTLGQRVAGFRVFNTGVTLTIDQQGRVVAVGGPLATGKATGQAKLDARQAVVAAAAAANVKAGILEALPDDGNKQKFANNVAEGVYQPTPITAELVWYPTDHGRHLQMAWYTDIELDSSRWFVSIINAESGKLLERINRFEDSSEGTVYDEENPEAPGAGREVHAFSGIDGNWVSGTTTSGNNVNAYRDLANTNAIGYQPTDANAHFNYAFTDAWRTTANVASQAALDADLDAVITQLFYYTNRVHDYVYNLGFDEVSRNFQVNNFGRGGSGNDPVLAEAQNGWDFGCVDNNGNAIRCLNNANFATPADGNSPRMQMFVWVWPFRDGDMDGDVIAHEYGHGVSHRLVGGGDMGSGRETGALGEGWSDLISMFMWDDWVVGEYATGNPTTGIRRVNYETSTEDYTDFDNNLGVHPNGEIWATVVSNIRKAKGIAYTEQLLIDGMKSTPKSPSFLDARDGLLAADIANTGGCNQCLIWRTFAERQMGVSATSDQTNRTFATDIPGVCIPAADAGGPYSTPEGTDVTLDGSGSTPASDPSAGAIVKYEWDLDNDGEYYDATGATTVFTQVGQDATFIIGLRVTDEAGNTDTDSTTVTVTNVAPTVQLDAIAAVDENVSITLSGYGSDPGWLDNLTGTVDWGDGAGPSPLPGVLENTRPDATLSFSVPHTYGDNGTFSISVCISDDDTSSCSTIDAVISNVNPTATIDPSGQTTYDGVSAYIVHAGEVVDIEARSTDPGSDDLTLRWKWNDGSPDSAIVSLVNPPNPDTPKSPSIQPRGVIGSMSHIYGGACLYNFQFSATDDDGGMNSNSAAVVIVGNANRMRSAGYWFNQYSLKKPESFTNAQLACYLKIATFMSTVFDTSLDTRAEAVSVLYPEKNAGSAQKLFDRQLLAAWLNFANGAIGLADPVDTNGDLVNDSTFGAAVLAAENVRNDPASTRAQLLSQRNILEFIVNRDG